MIYSELLTASAFSFLEGATHPEDLVAQAALLGHRAIGIADINTVSGVVQAHVAAKAKGLRLAVGSRLRLADAPDVVCYPQDRAAWGRLCRLLSLGKSRAAKGDCVLRFADVLTHAEGQIFIIVRPADLADFSIWATMAAAKLRGNCYIALVRRYAPDDEARLRDIANIAHAARVQTVARMTCCIMTRKPACYRMCCAASATAARLRGGFRLEPHGERHLKPAAEMARLLPATQRP